MARELALGDPEPAQVAGRPAARSPEVAILRRSSGQPTRRAVLHLHAAGDPALPADLGAWYTERGYHFYLIGLRLPRQSPTSTRVATRRLAAAFAGLDAACARLRDDDGIASIVVSAQARAAIVAALWRDSRVAAADALVLLEPRLSAGASLSLDIDCPVLVVASAAAPPPPAAARRWPGRRRSQLAEAGFLQLGGHVTWLRLPAAPEHEDEAARLLCTELGRWLGAYMYGQRRDQLL